MNALRYAMILTTVAAAALAGCADRPRVPAQLTADEDAATNPWTNLNAYNGSESFQFAIVADRTGGLRGGVFRSAVAKLNLLGPEFVMSVGDLIVGYTDNVDVLNEQWDEFDAMVAQLEMPFFYVVGNHDIANATMAEVWRRRLGRPYYHFVYKDVLFLALCTEDGEPDRISDEQARYFQDVLTRLPHARWTLVFMHKPLFLYDDPSGFAAIETALANRPYTVFAGHHHTYTKYVRHDRRYIRLGTTGGASGLRGHDYGQTDHITWVTMTDTGPRLANLQLAGIHDENMATEQTIRFVNALASDGVSIPAVIADGDRLTAATTAVHLTNVVDVPIRFAATLAAPDGVTVTPGAFERTIPVGGNAVVPLKLSAPAGIPAAGAGDIALNWTATADLTDRPQFTIRNTTPIGVEPRMACGPAAKPITVDGKLDEWGALPLALTGVGAEYRSAWSGADDGSLRFHLAYDDKHLYVAAKVTDDDVLDPRPTDARLSQRTNPRERMVVGLRPGIANDSLAAGVRAASRIADGGYTMEFAIPLEILTDRQGDSWDGFRFNIAQFDRDGETNAQLWWRPSWRSSASYLGSGAMDRE